jgi:hypothetical protein
MLALTASAALVALILSRATYNHFVVVIWLAIALAYVSFQGLFALMPVQRRPAVYDAMANTLFALDILCHVCVAVFCGVGWIGVGLLLLSWLFFGRAAGWLAGRRAWRDILRTIEKHEPDLDADERLRLAAAILEQRQRGFVGSR